MIKRSVFRSIEEWETALLTLPENSFFSLMRSIFGNIKTPFNKQKLIHDLTAFLSKKEIQKTIANYFDEDDHRVIAAIAILEEPFSGELESFFSGEYSYAELHGIILNLEERLIIYRFKDEAKSRLALNPVLSPVLKPLTEKRDILFPSNEFSDDVKTEHSNSPWSASFLACFISFLYDQQDLFKNQGGLRKKTLDDCKRLFPRVKPELMFGIFRAAGLLHLDELGKHHLDETRLNQLAALSEYERRVYLAAAMMVFYEQDENVWHYFSRSHVQSAARDMHVILRDLSMHRSYPHSTIHKMLEISEGTGKDFYFKKPAAKNNHRTEFVFEVLNALGLIEKVKHDHWKKVFFDYPMDEKNTSRKYISMDSSNSFIVFPEIQFADALRLARFSSLCETGTATRFEVTKDSTVRAYQLGMTSEEIITVLKNLSGTDADQNIIWQLKDWEKRYAEVALHKGVVLSLSKDRLYLANVEPFASMIAAVLAPGVFLLTVDDEDDAARALERAGVDIFARNSNQEKRQSFGFEKRQLFFPRLDTTTKHQEPRLGEEKNAYQSDVMDTDGNTSDKQKDHFRTILARMKLSKDQHDEIAARIERGLILTDEQMEASSVKYEKLEARGLDYVGKYNIAKQAIAMESLLEVVWSDAQGTVRKILGIPSVIEKANGEAILVMHSEKNGKDQGGTIRIALGKISLLRRIKQSIFGE